MSEHPHPEQGQATEQKRPVTEQDKPERKERLQPKGALRSPRALLMLLW
jgi:hypothetical protein